MRSAQPHVLLIDFCGVEPLLALMRAETLLDREVLPERGAAAAWLPALKRLLEQHAMALSALTAVGVVAGPGSFSGVRIGVAAAKGLCEAAALPLAAVSRLAVLARAAGEEDAVAVLHAGRGQVYLRTPSASASGMKESLLDLDALEAALQGRPLVIAEPSLASLLARHRPRLVQLGPSQILPVVLDQLSQGGRPADPDANYVRREAEIYRRPALAPVPEAR